MAAQFANFGSAEALWQVVGSSDYVRLMPFARQLDQMRRRELEAEATKRGIDHGGNKPATALRRMILEHEAGDGG